MISTLWINYIDISAISAFVSYKSDIICFITESICKNKQYVMLYEKNAKEDTLTGKSYYDSLVTLDAFEHKW